MSNPFRVVVVIGTRPEAVKLGRVLFHLLKQHERTGDLDITLVLTGQHSLAMVGPILDAAGVPIDSPGLKVERVGRPELGEDIVQNLMRIGEGVARSRAIAKGAHVIVQGDTSTTYAAAIVATLRGAFVHHVEAGLRSFASTPFPEEQHRRSVDELAFYHYCTCVKSASNVADTAAESRTSVQRHVAIVGQTGFDMLDKRAIRIAAKRFPDEFTVQGEPARVWKPGPVVIAMHRRDDRAHMVDRVATAAIAAMRAGHRVRIILHPSTQGFRIPIALRIQASEVGGEVEITDAIPVADFQRLIAAAPFVVTDSGGVHEEASYLGVPVIWVREYSERHHLPGLRAFTLPEIEAAVTAPPVVKFEECFEDHVMSGPSAGEDIEVSELLVKRFYQWITDPKPYHG